MIQVKIITLTTNVAVCEVVTDDGAQRFSCGAGTPAHEALRLIVHNAAHTIAKRKVDKLMADLAR